MANGRSGSGGGVPTAMTVMRGALRRAYAAGSSYASRYRMLASFPVNDRAAVVRLG
jgi:hypothetical protein